MKKRNLNIRYIFITGICLLLAGCGTSEQNQNVSQVEVEGLEESPKQPENEFEEEIREQSENELAEEEIVLAEPTFREIRKIIINMDNAMNDLTNQMDEKVALSDKEVRDCIGEYYDESLVDYAMFLYRIIDEDGTYVHDRNYTHANFFIDVDEEMNMITCEADLCEIEVTFSHHWEREWVDEVVPIRLERKENGWVITKINQWYNDFRYNYMPGDSFTPQCFTQEQAEDIIERFGTDESGNPIQLFINTDENGYILAESSERLLSEEEVEMLTRYELYMAIQEIYARHGKKFSDVAASQYFNRQSWYMPYEKVFSKEVLSDVEKANITLLSEIGKFTEEAYADYGNLYPISDKQSNMLTEEEAIIIIIHAFDMVDEVTTAREENYLEEESDIVFKCYSLGEYSDKESLRNYLSSWFSGDAIDYVINIYELCGGLYEDEDGRYQLVTDGSYFGDMQEIDLYRAATIKQTGEECIVSVPFINDKVGWGISAVLSSGEICLHKVGDDWLITEISQTYYDELFQEYLEYIKK